MKKITRITGALILASALAGCGGLELLAIAGVAKAGSDISIGFGRILTDATARALGCVLASGFGVLSETLKVEIETVEKNFIAEEIKTKKIVDPNAFFKQLDPTESQRLLALVKEAYDALDTKNPLRARPLEFYQGLLAAGLMSAIKENVQVRYVSVLRHIGDHGKPEKYETFGLSIRFLHAGEAEPKVYAVCE